MQGPDSLTTVVCAASAALRGVRRRGRHAVVCAASAALRGVRRLGRHTVVCAASAALRGVRRLGRHTAYVANGTTPPSVCGCPPGLTTHQRMQMLIQKEWSEPKDA